MWTDRCYLCQLGWNGMGRFFAGMGMKLVKMVGISIVCISEQLSQVYIYSSIHSAAGRCLQPHLRCPELYPPPLPSPRGVVWTITTLVMSVRWNWKNCRNGMDIGQFRQFRPMWIIKPALLCWQCCTLQNYGLCQSHRRKHREWVSRV